MSDQQTSALAIFYEKFGFKGLVRSLSGVEGAVKPDAKASIKAVASGGTGDLFAESADSSSVTETPESIAPVSAPIQCDIVLDWAAFDTWLATVQAAELTALDTETTSLNEMVAEVVGISLCVEPGRAAYIPLAHNYPDAPAQLPREEVMARLKPWLENPAAKKLGQHVKYDRHVLANTASRCWATSTTPCCKATCWKCTSPTA